MGQRCDLQKQIDLIVSDSEDSDSDVSSASSDEGPTAVAAEPAAEEMQEDVLLPAASDGTVQDTVQAENEPANAPDAIDALPASEPLKEGGTANTRDSLESSES